MTTNADGFEIVRSHSELFYMVPADNEGLAIRLLGELQLHITIALLKINAGCRQRIVKEPTNERLLEVLVKNEGCLSQYGDANWFYTTTPESTGGVSLVRKSTQTGQLSRFAIAWWTDAEQVRKSIRIFGDRIKPIIAHPTSPHLYPFGLNPYNVVYPESKGDPDHCSKCKKTLEKTTAFHVENPPHFLCAVCKYLHDTGFLPARPRKRKRNK